MPRRWSTVCLPPDLARACASAGREESGLSRDIARNARIYVAGHRGLVGSAIVRRLAAEGFDNLLLVGRDQLDLRDQAAVHSWVRANRPEYVYLVAGTVGGILPNSKLPADFLYDNLMIHATVVDASHTYAVKKLLYLGSSCIYPRESPQPMKEEYVLSGPLEPTNESYAIAKIAGIKLCAAYRQQYGSNFISAVPATLYGPYDNFDLETSHVLSALIRKFYEAKLRGEKQVTIWGTGTPRREFMHVDDAADCCLFLMRHYDEVPHINVGTGADCSIRELAELVRDCLHPDAELVLDTSKPDGMPRKLLDVSRLHGLGWKSKISLREGVARTCAWFASNYEQALAGSRSLLAKRGQTAPDLGSSSPRP